MKKIFWSANVAYVWIFLEYSGQCTYSL